MWVSPFRYPRIVEYLLLPVAFRSLSRLSSALSAKASTLRSFQLNLLTRVRVCSLVYVYSVRRLGLGSFQCVYIVTLITTTFPSLHLVWMSLSFHSLRSIMTSHYLCLYSVFKVHSLLSNNCNRLAELRSASSRASHYILIKAYSLTSKLDAHLLFIKMHCSLLAWRW